MYITSSLFESCEDRVVASLNKGASQLTEPKDQVHDPTGVQKVVSLPCTATMHMSQA